MELACPFYHKLGRFYKHARFIFLLFHSLSRPEQVWVSDITYVGGRSQHTYLALVTDAYSKKVMGFLMQDADTLSDASAKNYQN